MESFNEIICNGPSMRPTLIPGDKIDIEEAAFDDLRPGDIIVYNSPENIRHNIIHRIIGRDDDGLITRGDNNSHVDPYRIRPEHLPVRVIAFERGSKRVLIDNHGMFLHHFRLFQRKLRIFRDKFLYPACVTLADTGIFYPLGHLFKTEVREFKRPQGVELQLFRGSHRIGVFHSDKKSWQINLPWRLFIKAPDNKD